MMEGPVLVGATTKGGGLFLGWVKMSEAEIQSGQIMGVDPEELSCPCGKCGMVGVDQVALMNFGTVEGSIQ